MEHVVFLNKKYKGMEKIVAGEKRAESRWASGRRAPYGAVSTGDKLYFKNSGEPVTLSAKVVDVLYFEKLTKEEIEEVIRKYDDQMCMGEEEMAKTLQKKCGSIIFFDQVNQIEPFEIDKSNYSTMADWITIDNVDQIRLNP